MRVALITTDNREPDREYHKTVPWFGAAPEALLQGFAKVPEVTVHVVSCTQRPMAGSPGKLADNIWFHSLHVPKIGWLRTGYQGCIRAVRCKLRELQPDIVHGQGTERECAISAVFGGFPNVVTIHGNMAELARFFRAPFGSYGWLAARLENFTLPRTTGVFCNSAYTEGLVLGRARKTWRVPNAIRKEFFAPAGHRPLPQKPILLNIGAITPRKRQVELLAVSRELYEKGLAFELRFIGTADPQSDYGGAFLRLVREAEARGFARYLGTKNTRELIECMDDASAFVHFPSEEAFGLVVAEALARDLKLFGARVGGIQDIVSGVSGAELHDAEEWRELAAAMAGWLSSGAPPAAGTAAVVRARYHPEIIARRHVEIYQEVLSKSV